MAELGHAWIGTSGWNYRDWRNKFYPQEITVKRWLAYYASRFDSVEINFTFYRLPTEQTCDIWSQQTPDHFRFAVKASRYLTHIKRLTDAETAWNTFISRVSILKDKLGPVLLQFPSTFIATPENLSPLADFLSFAKAYNPEQRLALEFRDNSWFTDTGLALLRRYHVALVFSHSSKYTVPEMNITSDFAYFRLHGPNKMFASSYSSTQLEQFAHCIKAFLRSGIDVFGYFNNDSGCHAPHNALTLKQAIETAEA